MVFFFVMYRDLNSGLALAKQVLYHLSPFFASVIFQISVSHFYLGWASD
jgi:hypothetical protein